MKCWLRFTWLAIFRSCWGDNAAQLPFTSSQGNFVAWFECYRLTLSHHFGEASNGLLNKHQRSPVLFRVLCSRVIILCALSSWQNYTEQCSWVAIASSSRFQSVMYMLFDSAVILGCDIFETPAADVLVCRECLGPLTLLYLVPLTLSFCISVMQLIIPGLKSAQCLWGSRSLLSLSLSLSVFLSPPTPLSDKLEATSLPISCQGSEQRGRNYPLQNWSKQSQSGTARQSRRMKLGESVTFFKSLYHRERIVVHCFHWWHRYDVFCAVVQ